MPLRLPAPAQGRQLICTLSCGVRPLAASAAAACSHSRADSSLHASCSPNVHASSAACSAQRHSSLVAGACSSSGLQAAARLGVEQPLWRPSRILRRAACAAAGGGGGSGKKKLVFLGTPEVAAQVLAGLLDAAAEPGAEFEVAAVVSQPGRPKGRGARKVPQASPVEALARQRGYGDHNVLCPVKANEEPFLAALHDLRPDLCVTAAYGNILPQRFLDIPTFGTLNIHPSLLPAYRGAAPVQRALEDGCTVTGVSVAFTVRAMDAGPVLAQEAVTVPPDVAAPELLQQLFERGTALLLARLGDVLAGRGGELAAAQDEAAATHAAKLSKEGGELDLSQPASVLHNKVRAFAGWPGTFHRFVLRGPSGEEPLELKVLRTQVAPEPAVWQGDAPEHVHPLGDQALLARCGDGNVLKILEVQAPGKRAVAARDFINGLRDRQLYWQPVRPR